MNDSGYGAEVGDCWTIALRATAFIMVVIGLAFLMQDRQPVSVATDSMVQESPVSVTE